MGRKKFTRERPRAALSPPICPGHAFVFYDAEWQLMQKKQKKQDCESRTQISACSFASRVLCLDLMSEGQIVAGAPA